jgi:hypothetical protein
MSSKSNSISLLYGEQNLRKYQDESTKVSRVSVSLMHCSPSRITFFQSVCWSNGLPFVFKLIFSGSLTGKSFNGIFFGFPFLS